MNAPTIKQKPIDEATVPELREFAMIKGLEAPDSLNRKQLISLIRTVHTGENIDVVVKDGEEPLQAGAMKAPAAGKAKKFDVSESCTKPGDFKNLPRVTVIIAKSDQAGGDRHVFLAVNGVEFHVARGEPVDIPYPVYQALKSAVEWRYFQDQETREMKMVEVPRWPYQVVSVPEGLAA